MRSKNIFMLSLIVMVILLVLMGVNWLISPLPDMVIRFVGIMMIGNLAVLTYNTMKIKK